MNQNFNDPRHPWSRLAKAARDVRDDRDSSAPYGFATRVVALAFAQDERRVASLFERFAFRAVGVASLLALFSIVLNYDALSTTATTNPTPTTPVVETADLIAVDDAVSLVLDFAD
ncbi:MAG: hypothetical protein ACREH8_02390 [Opitutaceae bacterium]